MLDIETFFDASFYVDTNPDIAQSILLGNIQNPFDHFLQVGQFEGRDPHPLFDTNFYLEENPDVKAAVLSGHFTAIGHFLNHGQFEGRDPSPLFDTDVYLEQNPDVIAAFERDEITGIAHYLEFGQSEGRSQPITDQAGNTLSDAVVLDPLTGIQTFQDFVGEGDPQDLLRQATAHYNAGMDIINRSPTISNSFGSTLLSGIGEQVNFLNDPNTSIAEIDRFTESYKKFNQMLGNSVALGATYNNISDWDRHLASTQLDSYETFGNGYYLNPETGKTQWWDATDGYSPPDT